MAHIKDLACKTHALVWRRGRAKRGRRRNLNPLNDRLELPPATGSATGRHAHLCDQSARS